MKHGYNRFMIKIVWIGFESFMQLD